MMDTCHHMCLNPENAGHPDDSEVHEGLWGVRTRRRRSMDCNEHTLLVGDVERGEAVHVGLGIYGKSLYLPPNITVTPKLH